MRTLSESAYENARSFLKEHARPLERACFEMAFEDGDHLDVANALVSFQNPDGGFGNALEPDCRLCASSALATSFAFTILKSLHANIAFPLARRALGWLSDNYDREAGAWPIVPPEVNEAPRAPWWQYSEETPKASRANPSPELVGALINFDHAAPSPILADSLDSVLDLLDEKPELEMHELMSYLRLHSSYLSPSLRDRMTDRLAHEAQRLVVTEPTEWSGYGLRPLGVVDSPDSFLYPVFEESVQAELDYLIAAQGKDGSWSPTWSWFGNYDEVWPFAEREWKGLLTLDHLRKLRAFGRLPELD